MSLQQYVRQVRPRNESYIPPVDKIQNFLTESSTTDATNGEKAICFAYNHFIQRMDKKEALSKAGIEKLPPDKKWKSLIEVGKAVVEHESFKEGKRGDYLIHAGTSSASTHYAKPASDTTSKSDLYINDNTKQNISLKKHWCRYRFTTCFGFSTRYKPNILSFTIVPAQILSSSPSRGDSGHSLRSKMQTGRTGQPRMLSIYWMSGIF